MTKIVKIKKDPNTEELYLDLEEVLCNTNVTVDQIGYYQLDEQEDGSMKLVLYDKDKNVIEVVEK